MQEVYSCSSVANLSDGFPHDTPLPPVKDDALTHFRDAMNDVRPLRQSRAEPHLTRPQAVPRFSLQTEQEALQDCAEIEPVESGEELLFCRPGIRRGVFRKLRRGQFIVESELDLHGLTVRQAQTEVAYFLNEACASGERCVRIIHGKGNRSAHHGPVLKNRVNVWLRHRDDVLAFASAQPKDGGAGAVHVLLRRQ